MVTEHAKERAAQRMRLPRGISETILPQLWAVGRVATTEDLRKFWYTTRCAERRDRVYRVVVWRGRVFLMVVAGERIVTIIERPN